MIEAFFPILRCKQVKRQVKFFRVFLHYLIESELLMTNIYALTLASFSSQSKNTKYSEGVVCRENHVFQNIENFLRTDAKILAQMSGLLLRLFKALEN